MSYGVKYRCEWTNHFGQACKLDILKLDYSGTVDDVYCSREPIRFDLEVSSDFLLDEPIWGIQLIINLVATTDFQFLDLYTNNNREYKVIFYIDATAVWSGFILPDQYQEEYRYAPYTNSFIATDQLGFLRTLAWDKTLDNTVQYGYKTLTPMQALGYILGRTNLGLNLREGINVYEDRMNSTAADSPLDQCYFHGIAYDGKTYYDVLKDILLKFGAVLRQRNNQWFIFRPTEAHQAFTSRLWTFASGFPYDGTNDSFSYTSNTSVNLIVDSTSAPPSTALADIIRIANGTMSINPAWGKYTLLQDYVKVTNRILNGDFANWTAGVPDSWNIHAGLSYNRSADKIKIPALSTRESYNRIIQQVNTLIVKWDISIRYNIHVPAGAIMTVRFVIGITQMEEIYDNTSGTKETRQQITYNDVFDSVSYSGPPAYRLMTVSFEAPECSSTSAYIEIDQIIAAPMNQDGSDVINFDESSEQEIVINSKNNYDYGTIELIVADCPETTGFRDVFHGGIFLEYDIFGQPITRTYDWNASELSGTLVNLLKNAIGILYAQPQQVINVPIYSKLLDFCSIIKDTDNDDKLFILRRGSWSPKYGRWDVEAHELAITPQILYDETDTGLDDETGPLYG
jgi:hypothetical protein